MEEYETVSMCDDCRIVFPNGAMRKDIISPVKLAGLVWKSNCPKCGKEITTLLDDCYWLRVA